MLGIFVAMAFIASCQQQEGTTVTEEPANGPARVYESSCVVTDALAEEARLDFGCAKTSARMKS